MQKPFRPQRLRKIINIRSEKLLSINVEKVYKTRRFMKNNAFFWLKLGENVEMNKIQNS